MELFILVQGWLYRSKDPLRWRKSIPWCMERIMVVWVCEEEHNSEFVSSGRGKRRRRGDERRGIFVFSKCYDKWRGIFVHSQVTTANQ